MALRFFYNGVKGEDKKLQKYFFSWNADSKSITVYAKGCVRFSDEVRAAFKVENDSDIMTDYFEEDSFKVSPDHKLYGLVFAAYQKHEDKIKSRIQARTGGAK